MRRFTKYFPIYTLAAGIIGFVFRLLWFKAADERGLLPAGHPAQPVLWVLLGLSVLGLAIYFVFIPKRDFRSICSLPIRGIGYVFAALGCGGMLLMGVSSGVENLVVLLLCISFAFSGIFALLRKKAPLAIPALTSLLLIVMSFLQYRGHVSQTQLQEYLFPSLAFLFLTLYGVQTLMLDIPQRNFKTAFVCNQMALLCSLVCLSTSLWPFFLGISLWLIGELTVTPYRMILPRDALTLIRKLEKAGFSAYAVGGCVRDALLGNAPHDYDLCTNATPEKMCLLFADHTLVTSGEKHGTIGVVMGSQVYEITTYRTEGEYEDNRHPEWVEFVDDIQTDLARRDFTVNAMAFHPKAGYVDPFGGQQDLYDGILRAVGNPEERFQEDSLRILRGVRFACRFHLRIEQKTRKAMDRLAALTDNLARERVLSELTQILCCMEAKDLLIYQNIILQVIPELKACVKFRQHSPHHKYDVFTHTALTLSAVKDEPSLRWAALLHDIGKPQVFNRDDDGIGHFPGHNEAGAAIAEDILRRLKASNELREQVLFLILHHMDPLSADKTSMTKKISKHGADNIKRLVYLQEADRFATGKSSSTSDKDKLLALIEQICKEKACLQIRDLAVNGHDLMELGYEAGPRLGECQKKLLQLVLDGILPNEKEALLNKAAQLLPVKDSEDEENL